MFMLCRVEKRLPVRKSFEQAKSQHSSFQYGIEGKTNLRYSVGHIGITAAAICCRKDSRCSSKIRLHRAKWAISGRGSRDELAPDFEVNQVAIKILYQLITVQYVMSAYVDQCMGVCECEVEVVDKST